jgi:hypothetical protein
MPATDDPHAPFRITLEGGPLDGRVLWWSGGELLDLPVVAGTNEMIGPARPLEEGEVAQTHWYREDPASPRVFVHQPGHR